MVQHLCLPASHDVGWRSCIELTVFCKGKEHATSCKSSSYTRASMQKQCICFASRRGQSKARSLFHANWLEEFFRCSLIESPMKETGFSAELLRRLLDLHQMTAPSRLRVAFGALRFALNDGHRVLGVTRDS